MASEKISKAVSASTEIMTCWNKAVAELGKSTTTNGYGIFSDPRALECQMRTAQAELAKAVSLLTATLWPSDKDYQ